MPNKKCENCYYEKKEYDWMVLFSSLFFLFGSIVLAASAFFLEPEETITMFEIYVVGMVVGALVLFCGVVGILLLWTFLKGKIVKVQIEQLEG